MLTIKKLSFIVVFVLSFSATMYAQQADTTAAPADENQIIELGVSEIKVKVEAPQVTLFSDRLEPEFDEVHLEKSFFREIVGQGEQLKFDRRDVEQLSDRIDINRLLKKAR
ncbi:MAG TPA: hypothetical protein ENK44_09880 [Caldithrix abyssi]|uniref:DUF4140 domain-containing protein n=1 Tax=Caldithrix abyssi TaxID=187145 RepID=A0A7V4U0Z6_CALAY|nr:hypothetical protein [Caldithrix abyssi]